MSKKIQTKVCVCVCVFVCVCLYLLETLPTGASQ